MGDQDIFRHSGATPGGIAAPVKRGRNWIAVIGIDAYTHWNPLTNAVSDAQGVLKVFSDLDFELAADPLYNEQATLEAINSLVDELSHKLQPEDSLVLFYAGHGHTETSSVGSRKSHTGYLVPVGGRKPEEKRFASYIRLEPFLQAIAELPARHILVILDACYSGFALGRAYTKDRGSLPAYTDELERRFSRQVLTSAMNNQPALDNGPVVNHSLFTGVMIEGLERGKADAQKLGFVTASDLATHVQREVMATAKQRGKKQTPDFGTFGNQFDEGGQLLISLRGETQARLQAEERVKTAQHAMALGQQTGDRKRFAFAARQYQEAIDLYSQSKLDHPAARLGLGQARLAAGDPAGAAAALQELAGQAGSPGQAEACFYLGIAQARQAAYQQAADALETWRSANPNDLNAAWVGEYIHWLRTSTQRPGGRRQALLVGVEQYALESTTQIQGANNDVALMSRLLQQQGGFAPAALTELTGQGATRQAFQQAMRKLAQETRPEDSVFVHFSGHAAPASNPHGFGHNPGHMYLILADTNVRRGALKNGVTAQELHDWMQAIPAGRKTLVLDTHASQELMQLANQEGTYALIVASDTAELSYEWSIELDGQSIPCGMLTGALYLAAVPAADPARLTYAEWIGKTIEIARAASLEERYRQVQTPGYIGLPDWRVFGGASGGEDPFLPAFEIIQQVSHPGQTADHLAKLRRLLRHTIAAPFPQLHYSFGLALAAKGAYALAAEAFQAAIDERAAGTAGAAEPARGAQLASGAQLAGAAELARHYPQAWLRLAMALARLGHFAEARQALAQAEPLPDSRLKNEAAVLSALLAHKEHPRRRAVIALMDIPESYLHGGSGEDHLIETLQGIRTVLKQRYDLAEEDIQVLSHQSATREALLAAMQQEQAAPDCVPTLLILLGTGQTYNMESKFPTLETAPWPLETGEIEQAIRQSGQLFVAVKRLMLSTR